MKTKRVVAMMLLLACLFNVVIAGRCEQQSSSPIIQAVVPYLNSCMNFDDIVNYELDSSWDVWDRNTCIVQFDISEGNKTIGINDLSNGKFLLYVHTPSEERDYGQFFNEEILGIFYRMLPFFADIQDKLTDDIKLMYLLILGEDDYCVITSDNIGEFQ